MGSRSFFKETWQQQQLFEQGKKAAEVINKHIEQAKMGLSDINPNISFNFAQKQILVYFNGLYVVAAYIDSEGTKIRFNKTLSDEVIEEKLPPGDSHEY